MVRNALFIQKVTCILLFIYQQTQLKTLYKSVDNFSLTFRNLICKSYILSYTGITILNTN